MWGQTARRVLCAVLVIAGGTAMVVGGFAVDDQMLALAVVGIGFLLSLCGILWSEAMN